MKISILPFFLSEKYDQIENKDLFENRIKAIKSIGYDAVELAVRDPELVDLEDLKRILEHNGISVSAIGTGKAYGVDGLSFTNPDPQIRRKAIDRLKGNILFSEQIGKPPVIIGLIRGRMLEGVDRITAENWLLEALIECGEYASAKCVNIAFEPLNRYESNIINNVENALSLLDKAGCNNIGLLLDTFHMNIEEPVMEESIRTAGNRIFHFHIADSDRWSPGHGHLNFRTIIGTLYDTGYCGYLSGEIFYFDDPFLSARQTYEVIKQTCRMKMGMV